MLNSGNHSLYEYAFSIVLTILVTIVAFSIEPVAGHAAASSLYLLSVVIAGLGDSAAVRCCLSLRAARWSGIPCLFRRDFLFTSAVG